MEEKGGTERKYSAEKRDFFWGGVTKPQEGSVQGEASEEGRSNIPRCTLYSQIHPRVPPRPLPAHRRETLTSNASPPTSWSPHTPPFTVPCGSESKHLLRRLCRGGHPPTPTQKQGQRPHLGAHRSPPSEVTPLSRKPSSDGPAHSHHNTPVPFVPKSSVYLCYPPVLGFKLLKM